MAEMKEERVRLANAELLENGNLEAVEDFFSPEYVVHTAGKEYGGQSFVKRFITQLRAAITELQIVQVEILHECEERIVWQRTLRGNHTSSLSGIPPSGKKVEWRDMLVSRFEDEKIAEEWALSDLAGELLLKLPPD